MTALNDDNLESTSPLARRFRAMFLEQFTHLEYVERFTNRYELSIPAPCPELGQLRVRDDGDELTVCIGPHHWHNSLDSFDGESARRQLELVAEATINDIRSVVDGRTAISVRQRGGVIGSTI